MLIKYLKTIFYASLQLMAIMKNEEFHFLRIAPSTSEIQQTLGFCDSEPTNNL